MTNYADLSNNMLRILVADGDVQALEEQGRRSREALDKADRERIERDSQQYIKRRGGEPHVPNRKPS